MLLALMEKNAPINHSQEPVKLLVCAAPGCKNNNVSNSDVQFYSFPATQFGKRWKATLETAASPSSSMATVCSKHFGDHDYSEEQYLEGNVEKIRWTLKHEAAPFSSQSLKTDNLQQGGSKPLKEDCTEMISPEAEKSSKTLVYLTQKFMELLKSCPDGLLDINQAIEELKISRRRIYDITNVLEGILLIKKKSKQLVQWMGTPLQLMNEPVDNLVAEEKKLDDIIRYTKQQIHDMHENMLNNKFAYLTYKDIQSIPIFVDQAVFVIKAPPETTLEVAHPNEAFQMHIVSKKGPVKVFGCNDTVDVTQGKSQKSKFHKGDYSNLPLRGLTTAATSCKDNANHNTKSSNISTCPSEPTQRLTQVSSSDMSPKPSSVFPLHEVQNFSPPIPPLSITIKEEMTNLDITPDEPLNENLTSPVFKPDQLSTDVQMTDLS